jgi:guanidinoacetate N-methyltransferase
MIEEVRRQLWATLPVKDSLLGLEVGGYQVMQPWERHLMRELATIAANRHGSVLEVGFGMGISAGFIMEQGCTHYTVIEPHPEIASRARQWASAQKVPAVVIEDTWQNAVPELRKYDGILFDTYPIDEEERELEQYQFVRPFLELAPQFLAPQGLFTYYSDETRDFRPAHLRLVLQHFNKIELNVVEGLDPPPECDYWHSDHMVVPCISDPRVTK